MSSTDTHLSSRDYERRADESRRRLSNALDALTNELTPGRVVDEVLGYARIGGGNFLLGLGNSARHNPLPTLMIGLGAAMFLSGKGRVEDIAGMFARSPAADGRGRASWPEGQHAGAAAGYANGATRTQHSGGGIGDFIASLFGGAKRGVTNAEHAAMHAARTAGSTVAHGATSAAHAVGDGVAGAGNMAADMTGEVAGAARHAAGGLGSAASRAAGTVAGAASDLGHQAVDAAGNIVEEVGHMAEAARDRAASMANAGARMTGHAAGEVNRRAGDLIREQPLLVGVAGLAIGGMIAALLPRTETEDRLMGETSDAVKHRVGDMASSGVERAVDTAEKVVETAGSTAREDGLSSASAAKAMRDVGDTLSHVAEKTRQAVSEELSSGGKTDDRKTTGEGRFS